MTLTLDRIRDLRADARSSIQNAGSKHNLEYWSDIDAALAAAEALARLVSASERDYLYVERGGGAFANSRSFARPWKVSIGSGPRESRKTGEDDDLLTALTRALDEVEGKS